MERHPDRIERILALLLIQQSKTQREKIVSLNIAGFTNTEIADLLQTTSAVVSQELYATRKGKTRSSKARA